MATKKSGGSSRNGRDSAGRRLGLKENGYVQAGNILVRQRGTVYHPGYSVGMGKDHTLYAKSNGFVYFTRENVKGRVYLHVENGTQNGYVSLEESLIVKEME
uniref:Ribosomal protein L27 n=1 Tax=Andalucia godoyi TaxID=505711 RepID=M4QKN2_ANDGO|nr:ribosomal protein L27 [Andalucia godoyi]AGH24028.1 ribosomal protein L27 [Andalucia godoyi]